MSQLLQRPLVILPAVFLLLAVGLSVTLNALDATPVLRWLPHAVSGTGYLADNRSRVAAVTEMWPREPHGTRLLTFVGISNVREDIDLGVVERSAATAGWRYLGLGGAGLGMPDVAAHAGTVLDSGLVPDVLVLGLALHQLIDSRPRPRAKDIGVVGYARRGDLRNVVTSLRGQLWFYARRQDVSLATENSLLDLRARLFRGFGVRLDDETVRQQSPWREMLKSPWPEHFSAATLREEEQFFEEIGAFDPSMYRQDSLAMTTFVDLVRRFKDRGSSVLIVLLPDHPVIQRRIPQAAKAVFDQALNGASRPVRTAVIDLRAGIDSDGFVDLSHLNRKGSAQFSASLGERLKPFLQARAK